MQKDNDALSKLQTVILLNLPNLFNAVGDQQEARGFEVYFLKYTTSTKNQQLEYVKHLTLKLDVFSSSTWILQKN